MFYFRLSALAAAFALFVTPSLAGDTAPQREPIVDSVVLGVVAHNVQDDEADGFDPNLEVRFNLPLGLPEGLELLPTIGGTANISDDGADFGYAGATLRYQHSSGIFIEGFLGFAAHTADTPVDADEADLGCEFQFREAGEIGYAWDNHRIGAIVAHYSHGGILCSEDENDGITQVGVRYGYRF